MANDLGWSMHDKGAVLSAFFYGCVCALWSNVTASGTCVAHLPLLRLPASLPPLASAPARCCQSARVLM